jgi:tetratricopeptide (TPR) repeat protein
MIKLASISLLSVILLIPYFGWGLYVLRQRFRHDLELNHALEVATLAGLAVFYAIEIALLRSAMQGLPVLFFFALLGLVVSSAALYGPMLVSLISFVIVEAVMPIEHSPVNEPRYGPAEALERQGDYEGAIKEYMVIARVFPKDPTAALRVADNYMKLGQPEEAAPWFERALVRLDSPQKSLLVANRLSDVYTRHLDRPADGLRVLEEFVGRYPSAEQAEHVRQRIKGLQEVVGFPRRATQC